MALDKAKIESLLANSELTMSDDMELTIESAPMSGIRKAISKAMTFSSNENAGFTGMRNMNITKIFNARNEIKDLAAEKGVKVTYLAFIVKAAAMALQKFPNINVRIDKENNAILNVKEINIGIAVDTPKGLIVPNIKNADQLNIFQIAKKIDELATKARDGKISMKEIQKGTFTVTNFGSVKLDYATPIINSPESAILGVGNMTKTPVYEGDTVVPAYIMPFSMTSDHRLVDGADVGRFLNEIDTYFQNPEQLFN